MIETVFAQLRFAVSLIRDSRIPPRSLDRLIAALQDTRREFGEVNLQGETLVTGPTLDEEKGWTFPRQVAEALEAIEDVPLPARYGFQAVKGGVTVEVVTQTTTPRVRSKIGASLEEQGVPLRALHLVEDRHCCSILCPCEEIYESSYLPQGFGEPL